MWRSIVSLFTRSARSVAVPGVLRYLEGRVRGDLLEYRLKLADVNAEAHLLRQLLGEGEWGARDAEYRLALRTRTVPREGRRALTVGRRRPRAARPCQELAEAYKKKVIVL